MKIAIFGLGYVGSVTAACLAKRGFHVIGVDVHGEKIAQLNQGRSPVLEPDLSDLIAQGVRDGRLAATTNAEEAVAASSAALVCVGTPSQLNGNLDLQYVCRVAEQIGDALKSKDDYYSVIFRSTMLPGTTWDVVRPILEKRSGKQAGREFGLCFNPEFLREGNAISDFQHPPFTVLGAEHKTDADEVKPLYDWLDAELIVVPTRIAETVKYINNCYHALKVTFANEVGRICRALRIDSHEVMEIFCRDTKQNISSSYLKPGFAFGGSCLPKDLRALLYQAKTLDVPMEVFSAILPSNQTQIDLAMQMVELAGHKKVGLLGLSFKAGTDDLRESPLVTLAERLYGRGYDVRIFDDQVHLSQLVGANRAYIEQQLPHIGAMLHSSLQEVVERSETIVIGNAHPEFRKVVADAVSGQIVIDLVRVADDASGASAEYQGIGW